MLQLLIVSLRLIKNGRFEYVLDFGKTVVRLWFYIFEKIIRN